MRIKTILLLSLPIWAFSQSNDDLKYIRTYAKTAVEEMTIYKIPASIILAQGLVETADGQSILAAKAFNHFGIKCKETWKGETFTYTDDAPNECFRKYNSVWESYRDHSKFLAERPHYKKLFEIAPTDYKGWAYGLKKSGYATNPRYPQLLIGKIEKYGLYKFDNLTSIDLDNNKLDELVKLSATELQNIPTIQSSETPIELTPEQRIKNHSNGNIKYVIIEKGDNFTKLSQWYKISVSDLKDYNEMDQESDLLVEKQCLFLEEKNNAGATETHKVQKNETMYSIAQKEAMKISRLYYKNNMDEGNEPSEGEVLYLQAKKPTE